jgi:hypothetical protein
MYDMIYEVFGLFGALLIMYASVTKFTTLAAITQMGSIQERALPWAQLSRPKSQTEQPKDQSTTRAAEKDIHSVRDWDKFVYTASVINVALTTYILGACPQYFYLWHTPKAILYTTHRWYTFRQQNQHYLLYDFCYWANGLSLLYLWVFPDSALLFQILFVVSNGPLAWSVLAFSQSLIFHSAPHMTSVFIHTSPMVLTYAIRWYPTPFAAVASGTDPLEIPAFDLVYNAVTKFYGWWVVLYYVWVYIIMGSRIKARGYKTLFDRVVSRGPTKFITRVSSNDLVQKAAYMLTHFVFALFTMTLTVAYWRHFWIHVFFVLAIFSVSAWNASGFYFTVFVSRYEEELKTRAGVEAPKSK